MTSRITPLVYSSDQHPALLCVQSAMASGSVVSCGRAIKGRTGGKEEIKKRAVIARVLEACPFW